MMVVAGIEEIDFQSIFRLNSQLSDSVTSVAHPTSHTHLPEQRQRLYTESEEMGNENPLEVCQSTFFC